MDFSEYIGKKNTKSIRDKIPPVDFKAISDEIDREFIDGISARNIANEIIKKFNRKDGLCVELIEPFLDYDPIPSEKTQKKAIEYLKESGISEEIVKSKNPGELDYRKLVDRRWE